MTKFDVKSNKRRDIKMKCPKCGKDVTLQNRKVGVDEQGNAIYNQYAVCRDCKKQWNLDKQRAKKAAEIPLEPDTAAMPIVEYMEAKKRQAASIDLEKTKMIQKKAPAQSEEAEETPRYSNIPSQEVRVKRERVVKKNYEDMLSTDPEKKRKKSKPKPQPIEEEREEEFEYDDYEEDTPRFRVLRVLFGIISLAAFGFFTYQGIIVGLDNITSGSEAATGTTFIILALGMLLSGLLLLILQKKNHIVAFLFPTIFCIAAAAFGFMKFDGDRMLLLGSIGTAAEGALLLILTIFSRMSGVQEIDEENDDEEEEEDE